MALGIFLIISDVSVKFPPSFPNTEAAFNRCSTKIVAQQNYVMKYSSSAPLVKSKVLRTNYWKNCAPSQVFSKEFDRRFRTAKLKNSSRWLLLRRVTFWEYSRMAASQRQQWRYILFKSSKAAFTLIYILMVYVLIYILIYTFNI